MDRLVLPLVMFAARIALIRLGDAVPPCPGYRYRTARLHLVGFSRGRPSE